MNFSKQSGSSIVITTQNIVRGGPMHLKFNTTIQIYFKVVNDKSIFSQNISMSSRCYVVLFLFVSKLKKDVVSCRWDISAM